MLQDSQTFSGFSVDSLDRAEEFYGKTLGLKLKRDWMGLQLKLANDDQVFIYEKPDHQAANYTNLNFIVDDIDKAIDELTEKGIKFEQYDLGNGAKTDEKGVLRGRSAKMGPDIAWFKDPAGNTLSILQQ
ncbi:VOC family protein [Candidatus Saccharibacteria bacterium]|nr:MAG: VOC family protein [Candidatus Saccharibacteria bacterium]